MFAFIQMYLYVYLTHNGIFMLVKIPIFSVGYTYTQKDNKIWTGVLYVCAERRKPNEFEFIHVSLVFTSVSIALGIIRDLWGTFTIEWSVM